MRKKWCAIKSCLLLNNWFFNLHPHYWIVNFFVLWPGLVISHLWLVMTTLYLMQQVKKKSVTISHNYSTKLIYVLHSVKYTKMNSPGFIYRLGKIGHNFIVAVLKIYVLLNFLLFWICTIELNFT